MTSVGNASLGRLMFVGTVHEAEPALGALIDSPVDIVEVLTVPVERAAPSRLCGSGAVRRGARYPGSPNCQHQRAEEVEHIRQLAPDVIVVVGWTRLLGAEVLAIPPRGCIGFHASLSAPFPRPRPGELGHSPRRGRDREYDDVPQRRDGHR